MYLGQKKSHHKLRNLDFSFRMKGNVIDGCARVGVCNMHELHFKIGRRVGKSFYISVSGSYLYQCNTQYSGQAQSRIFQKLKVYKIFKT